jgi:hypothetical protein
MTDPAADTGEGMVLLEKHQRFAVLARVDQSDIALYADVGGAGGAAGRRAFLGNGESPRNRLGVLLKRRFALPQPFVVFIRDTDGADLGALPAAGAFIQVNKTRLLFDPGGKIAGRPFQPQ